MKIRFSDVGKGTVQMSRFRVFAFWVFVGLTALAGPALADPGENENHPNNGHGPKSTHSAPEIDPIAAGAVLAVVLGGTTVLAARRARRKSAR